MRLTKSLKIIILLLAALPMLGAPCTEEKVIDYVVGFATTIQLIASGSVNVDSDSGLFNLKADLDLGGALDDANIDPLTLTDDQIKIVQILYRVYQPDQVGDRVITGGMLEVTRPPGAPAILVSGWGMDAGVGNVADPTKFIDITKDIGAAGIAELNAYIRDCIRELRDGTPVPDPNIKYTWKGTSSSATQPSAATSFEYEVKVVFQGRFPRTEEIPF